MNPKTYIHNVMAAVSLLVLLGGCVSGIPMYSAKELPHPSTKGIPSLTAKGVQIGITPLGGDRIKSGSVEVFQLPSNGSSLPAGIAWGVSGEIWIAEAMADSIARYTPSTGSFEHFPTSTPGGQPYGVVSDPQGNVWFTEYMGDKVGVLYSNGTILEFPVSQKGSYPYEIIHVNGKVWFDMVGANAIGYIDTDTLTMEEFVLTKSGYQPVGIAADPKGEHIYIAGFGGTGVMEFNTTSRKFTEYPLGLNICWGIRVLANGTILISSLFDDAVTMWDPVTQKTITYTLPQYTYPTRIALGPNNTTYVMSYMGQNLFRINLNNGNIEQFAPPSPGRLWSPIDEIAGKVWISDPMKDGLWMFDAVGKSFKFTASDGKGHNAQPIGITKSGDLVWVAEYGTGHVTSFDTISHSFKSYPAGESSGPADVAVDDQGNVLVTLSQNQSIGIVDITNGTIKEKYLGDTPWRVAVSGDSVWIAGTESLIRYWPGNNSYHQYLPDYENPGFIGIDIDKNGDIWLASRGYSALFRFDPESGVFTMIRTRYLYSPPYDVKVMDDGSIWFTQAGSSFGPIGRYYPSNGTIQEYFTPKSSSGVPGLSIYKDIVWLTDYLGNAIWRFDSKNVTFERYELPCMNSYPYYIVAGDNEAWATGNGVSQIIHVTYNIDLGKISGKVIDSEGAPIPSANVKIRGMQSFDLVTDSNGEFRVDALPGEYKIEASAKGYFNASGSVKVEGLKTSTITLVLQFDPSSLLGWVTGCVTDSENASMVISGAEVIIGDRYTKTDASGRFNITIPEGSYTIRVTNNSYFPWNGTVTVIRGKETIQNISLLKIPKETPPPQKEEMPWSTILIALLIIIIIAVLLLLYFFYFKKRPGKGVTLPEIRESKETPPSPGTPTTPPAQKSTTYD